MTTGITVPTLLLGMAVWTTYLVWSSTPAFVRATRSLWERDAALELVVVAYAVPIALVAVALELPATADAAAALAALFIIAGQVLMKNALIGRAAQLPPVTLTTLNLSRRPS